MEFICDVPKKYCSLRSEDNTCLLGKKCEKIIDKCLENGGCNRIENEYCKSYAYPSVKWRLTNKCPMASNIVVEKVAIGKRRVGQQKQKKRH